MVEKNMQAESTLVLEMSFRRPKFSVCVYTAYPYVVFRDSLSSFSSISFLVTDSRWYVLRHISSFFHLEVDTRNCRTTFPTLVWTRLKMLYRVASTGQLQIPLFFFFFGRDV